VTTEVSVRRSILALLIVLALVIGAPGLAWAGHKFRIKTGSGVRFAGRSYATYEMAGTLPLSDPPDLPQAVTNAIQAACLTPTPTQPPTVQFIYVNPAGQSRSSTIDQADTNGVFLTTVQLPVTASSVTYKVRLRCDGNPVTVNNQSTLFTVSVRLTSLAFSGASSAVLALAGVALLLAGCLLLVYERRLARAG
jgi:hypothetical protein